MQVDPKRAMTEQEEIMVYCEEARNQCNCSCHSSCSIMHIVACCSPCPYCHLRITRGGLKRHLKKLHPEKVDD